MRMNQDERRFDFHGLGAALKRAREEKGWTQAYVAELVDRDSRTIMNIETVSYTHLDVYKRQAERCPFVKHNGVHTGSFDT